jgi:hypothetical protein
MSGRSKRADFARQMARWSSGVTRRVGRARRRGLGTVLSEDARRLTVVVRRFLLGLTHDCRPNATPIYIVGLQRSGTTMLIRAFGKSPEIEFHDESPNSRAYSNWAFRSDEELRSVIVSSRHRCVVFKALEDSLRIVHLIEGLGTPSRGRAVWLYRDVADQIRSFLAMFEPSRAGAIVRQLVRGDRSRQDARLSEETLEFVRRCDPDRITDAGAAALLWYVRNVAFFDLGLDRRPDVRLVSYDQLVSRPESVIAPLCQFVGIAYLPEMVAGIARRSPTTPETPDIDPELASQCAELQRRLDAEFERQAAAAF